MLTINEFCMFYCLMECDNKENTVFGLGKYELYL